MSRINKNLVLAIPVMLLLGFGAGLVFDPTPLKVLILPFTFLMVYPMMVNLKFKKVLEGGDTKAQVITQVINFTLLPLLAFGLGRLFLADRPYLVLGLLLVGIIPTSGMTISWAGLAKGNVEAAIKMTVVGLILGALATPFYVQWLAGAGLAMDPVSIARQMAIIVFLPLAAGFTTRRLLIRRLGRADFQKRLAPKFPPYSTLGVLAIVFIAMALKSETIVASPQVLLRITLPLILFYTASYLLSTIIGRATLDRPDALALVFGSSMRNLSIALALAINAFGPSGSEAALVVAVAYVIQVQSAAWYVKLSGGGSRQWAAGEREPVKVRAGQG